MSEVKVPLTLHVLVVGLPAKTKVIAQNLALRPEITGAHTVLATEYAFHARRHDRSINTVFLDPFNELDDPHDISLFILETRVEAPEVVFVLLASDADISSHSRAFLPELQQRIKHYYTLDPALRETALESRLDVTVRRCLEWHRTGDPFSERSRYEYDVAISFAGEDREFARNLAAHLVERGVRVFFDDYERPTLWGKDLYTTLYEIYSQRARYCIILVSAAYRDKMWTGHERQAAQERALQMRDAEYILPVRLEDVRIPGLPSTISYLHGELPVPQIAEMFVRKLASTS
jgi:hypothetical protein